MSVCKQAAALGAQKPFPASPWVELMPQIPSDHGIYMFTEDGRHRYVGRSRGKERMRKRIGDQVHRDKRVPRCRADMALNFAKNIAKEAIGRPVNFSREEDCAAVDKALERIRGMEVRWLVVPLADVDLVERAAIALYNPTYNAA